VQLELSRPGAHRYVAVHGAHGAAAVPTGYWDVTVHARDAAGNVSERALGLVVGRSH
jgi:hypothetical protein